jgi:hypothetical protein
MTADEWDWVTTASGERLHAPQDIRPREGWEPHYTGTTACDLRGNLFVPGVFSRMGMPRCLRCCAARGYPPGTGSPMNDAQCRPLVEQRLRELEGQ